MFFRPQKNTPSPQNKIRKGRRENLFGALRASSLLLSTDRSRSARRAAARGLAPPAHSKCESGPGSQQCGFISRCPQPSRRDRRRHSQLDVPVVILPLHPLLLRKRLHTDMEEYRFEEKNELVVRGEHGHRTGRCDVTRCGPLMCARGRRHAVSPRAIVVCKKVAHPSPSYPPVTNDCS